jgi:hypothetical protein
MGAVIYILREGNMLNSKLLVFIIALAIVPALFFAGCGEESGSPGDVVKQVFEAYNSRNFILVYDLSSTELQQQAGVREEAIAQMGAGWPAGTEITDLVIVEETIDGDTATVKWSGTIKTPELPDESSGATVTLVKEDGEWKLDS